MSVRSESSDVTFTTMSPNTLINDRYRLIDIIEHGDTGSVWVAFDVVLDREVAVKEIRPGRRAGRIRRLKREARSSARLSHPGVVPIHDVVEQGSRVWVVMKYVRAPSLQEIIDRDGPMAPGRAAEIGRQTLEALEAGHRAGVMHRAVRPSKILVTPENRVVLIGFGLARPTDTTGYSPPEGLSEGPAYDLWSLGATLYAAVEGHAPQNEAVREPRNAGPLSGVLKGLLTREPALRMTGAEALPLLAGISTAPPSLTSPGKNPQWDATVVFRASETGGDYEPVDWNLPVSLTKKHRHDSYVLKTSSRKPEPVQPPPAEEPRSVWQAFAEGFGGIFGLGGRRHEQLPPFESTLADDVHELCLALGLVHHDERPRE
jgi:serine/threonine protein kinase